MEIIAYTSPGCFYCDQLKELFRRADVEYELVVIKNDEERQNFREKFPTAVGYPHVLIDGQEYPGLVPVAKLFVEKGLVSSKK
jgi:glutaredoxin